MTQTELYSLSSSIMFRFSPGINRFLQRRVPWMAAADLQWQLSHRAASNFVTYAAYAAWVLKSSIDHWTTPCMFAQAHAGLKYCTSSTCLEFWTLHFTSHILIVPVLAISSHVLHFIQMWCFAPDIDTHLHVPGRVVAPRAVKAGPGPMWFFWVDGFEFGDMNIDILHTNLNIWNITLDNLYIR